ncbi:MULTISPECIES: hypothetical protein [unclassified Streptomyces]|uniref:hypothetical protein n=1 Tax=unclassified Streptomyces TaxID=2593676 RepID=UPI000DBA5EC3|nr:MULTISPECIES: hypothetical protein [unclassified Streptomyces]MYT74930.1 hypothetical protein [Streptomyces sp. SID8367]RAJ91919.1 hypothetical protein K377_00688 [Streptomyces sp. PsTaAH-137]
MTSPTADGASVTVTLTDCTPEDARSVLTRLTSRFPDRSGTANAPSGEEHPTVWTAELDIGGDAPASSPHATIGGPVSVTAQGAPHDVSTLRAALTEDFGVEDAGTASGDQERESQFVLVPR